jgi:hypothetical protein
MQRRDNPVFPEQINYIKHELGQWELACSGLARIRPVSFVGNGSHWAISLFILEGLSTSIFNIVPPGNHNSATNLNKLRTDM